MKQQTDGYQGVVETRFPGLIDTIHGVILKSENEYEGAAPDNAESFLWEHSLHTASIAFQLAKASKTDPLLPVIAALFHDAGKFAGGKYHADERTIEEEDAARIAQSTLKECGAKSAEIRQVVAGLKALYREKVKKNRIAAILHDADFLSKFGALGVAVFFIKSALRRRTLRSTMLGYLSKELTYASCLALNMHTAAGKRLAARKASDSLKFFRSLLAELQESQIVNLTMRRLRIADPAASGKFLTVQLVASPVCTKCEGEWEAAWTTEDGIKCHKLSVDWVCSSCGHRLETSFCLPEVV
jgi:HD superfamily phosphodiesterase